MTSLLKPQDVLKALSFIQAHTRPNIESNQMTALLHLYKAGDEGMSVGEVGDAVSVSHVSGSRIVRVMGKAGLKGNKEKGWDLVEIYYDPERPRATMARLNPKGRKVVGDFLSLLSVD
jgi:DNA-binding MarR family transcriptional regulator